MKTATKYILMSTFIAILTITLFWGYSLDQYNTYEIRENNERREACIQTFWQLLADKGTDFRVVDGNLLVGNYKLNGNFDVPDKVQKIFGGVATIFMGDERVSTNVLNADGKRALGTRLVGPAYDAIFKQEKSFRGEATILGVSYLTAYDPIRDRTGKIIGVLFVGAKENESLARVTELRINLTLTLVGMVTVFLIFMIMLGRAMKRIEDANENQLRFQQTLLDTIPSPVFYKDTACRYIGCNKAFETFIGYSQEELVGKTPHDIWPKESADLYWQQDMALLENSGLQVYEDAVIHADGAKREVIFNKASFEGADGAVAGLVGVILDITERKLAEEATKNAFQQMFDIIEFLPEATFVVDKDKRVVAWNRAIERMTGVAKQEIVGKGDYEYALPFYGDNRPMLIDLLDQEQERIRRNYKDIKQEGHTLFTEIFVPSFRNGNCRYFWARATPLFDKDGNRDGGIESICDITEYKKTEEERLRVESQLHHARMIETFMVRLSHDLRTPLTPLTILLPLIRKRVADQKLINLVDICFKSTTSMKKLADKAQLLSSLSATIKTDELEPINLISLTEQCIGDCADILAPKNVVCQTDIAPSIIVQAVPDQLKELFANLISNAVRFSPENGVIRITAEQRNATVTVAVHDDGIGLATDHLERIFDEFFKADESRHDLSASGLGLNICKRICCNHHGRIWAESPGIGKGTTLKFTINEQGVDRQHIVTEPK
ncbi:MAG: PAS domain-containing protein [Pedobacter sp.]